MDADLLEKIKYMYQDNASIEGIKATTGIPRATIIWNLRKTGIYRPRKTVSREELPPVYAADLENESFGFRKGDRVVVRFKSDGGADEDNTRFYTGVIEDITKFYFLIMTDRGYRITVNKAAMRSFVGRHSMRKV